MGARGEGPGGRKSFAPCGRALHGQADPCQGCPHRWQGPEERTCPLWTCCVQDRGLRHCGLCLDFPCQVFLGHADGLTVGRRYRFLLTQP